MYITKIEEDGAKKKKIFIDGDYEFWIYNRDAAKYKIKENMLLSPELYDEIRNDIVLKNAKRKALALLKQMDRTKTELVNKLKQAGYTENIAQLALGYVEQYNYIDDRRYTEQYLTAKGKKESKRLLFYQLQMKGIDSSTAEEVYHELFGQMEEDAELEALRNEIKKRSKGTELDFKAQQKLIAALRRKGFSLELIRKELKSFIDFE